MAEQNPHSRSYAILLDPEGMIVYHPNPQMLGRPANESSGFEAFREVLATGRQTITYTVSEYLGVDEERIYYPLQLGRPPLGGRASAFPAWAIEQDIDDFHFYTILTAVISVLFFATLLIVAQRRWRREYDRGVFRSRSRRSASQQVLEQIDPISCSTRSIRSTP